MRSTSQTLAGGTSSLGGAPLLQGLVVDRVAVWQDGDEFGQPPALMTLRAGFRDADGKFLTEEQGYELIDEMCAAGECDERGDPWTALGLTYVALVAPTGSYPVFEAAETTATAAIGAVAMVLTFPVVSRRRPT